MAGEGVAGQGGFQAPLHTAQDLPMLAVFTGSPCKTSFEHGVLEMTTVNKAT
jgi:hypothetical protein